MIYKFSRYNKWGSVGVDQILIYNTFSSAVAILSEEEFGFIFKDSIEAVSAGDADLMEQCFGQSFIVPANENELAKLIAIRNANNFCTNRAGFQILPTTDCNARCFYCYEKDFVGETMSDMTVEATIEFILKYCEHMDEVSITWFGGEPLLREDIIAKISSVLIPRLEARGIAYSADLITNGSYVQADCAARLKSQYRIKSVQITLDGQGEEYLRRKAYLHKDISYQGILEAIELLAKNDIDVLVRLNIDKINIESCLIVLDDLFHLQAAAERIWPYAAPIYSNRGYKYCISQAEMNEVFIRIFTRMIDRGFISTVNGLPTSFMNASCCAKGLNNFVISPTGEISKCEHLLNAPEEVVGSVYNGITFTDVMAKWTDSNIPERCKQCATLPICQAGCEAAEKLGFGYGRCSYIAFIDDAIIQSVKYLLNRERRKQK